MESTERRVSLFLPCLADMFYPRIGTDTVRILKRAGFAVSYPRRQTCCGQPAMNVGLAGAARAMARRFIRVFESAPVVVCPSGSCVLTVRQHYPELFRDEPGWRQRARALGEKTFELTDFLVNRAGAVDLKARYEARATLHDSCHPLRGLGLKDEPRRLLAQVEGLELVEMPEAEVCCGFGGSFMARFGELSAAMAHQKIDQAAATGAEVLILTEPGCLLNVDSALRSRRRETLRAVHLTEILAGGWEEGRV